MWMHFIAISVEIYKEGTAITERKTIIERGNI